MQSKDIAEGIKGASRYFLDAQPPLLFQEGITFSNTPLQAGNGSAFRRCIPSELTSNANDVARNTLRCG
jgi:hypothetical protein